MIFFCGCGLLWASHPKKAHKVEDLAHAQTDIVVEHTWPSTSIPHVYRKSNSFFQKKTWSSVWLVDFCLEISKLTLFEFFWKLIKEVLLFQCLAVCLILLALVYDLEALSQCHKNLWPTKNHSEIMIQKFFVIIAK